MDIADVNKMGFWKRLAAWFVGPTDPRDQIIEVLDDTIRRDRNGSFNAQTLVIEIDNFADVRHIRSGKDVRHILRVLEQRLKGRALLPDVVRRLDGDQFAVAVSPMRGFDCEELRDLALTVQQQVSEPITIEDGTVQLSVSIGCATSQFLEDPRGEDVLEAARNAQAEAAQQGPGSVLAYCQTMADRIATRRALLSDALKAIETGDIQAFFQPQICLTTSRISGFEALARWNHRTRGLISPAEFLPVLEEADMMGPLGLVMLRDALRALRAWDDAGYDVPNVSVNMTAEELRNPNLIDVIKFELDAFDLRPPRLVIEVLETVVANSANDPLIGNLHALSKLGCSIDLDDFGTGHASITTIQEFAINRIKIDRSFVSHIDSDEAKQKMVETILAISKSLAIETLAEGVETLSEIEHLAKNGCGHAQGFAISRPLPASETAAWIQAHGQLERRAG